MTAWCIHYRHGAAGEHLCTLHRDVIAMAGGCKSGVRFTMPCSSDWSPLYEKRACPDRRTPHEEIMERAFNIRAMRASLAELRKQLRADAAEVAEAMRHIDDRDSELEQP